LSGRKFNLIFSDGVHSAETLRTEYNFLNTNDLVAEAPFAMVWDDLYTVEMQSAFHDVTTKLRHKLGGGESAMFMLPGSYGFPRLTGVFSVGL
jgi:hypothetical protein